MNPDEFMRSLNQQHGSEQSIAAVRQFAEAMAAYYLGLATAGVPQEHALALTMDWQATMIERGAAMQGDDLP